MKQFDHFKDLSPWPVVGLHDAYGAGFRDEPHTHDRAQLLYASSGVMTVTVENSSFVIPPQRAVWIPSHHVHSIFCRGPVSLRTLYFDEEATGLKGRGCHIVEVSDLLRALIVELARLEIRREFADREHGIIKLMIGELKEMRGGACHAPLPSDVRLMRVCQVIMERLDETHSLDELAVKAGMGRRTFTRLFRQQTGMGVAAWRHQVRLMEAVSLLATGRSITSVAFDVGYESASAFTAMFNRSFGVPPSQYFSRSEFS